jgi:hypothetical protein
LLNNGFGLTATQYKDYVVWLARQAAAAGMGIGLQDSTALIDATTAGFFSWAVSLQCMTRGNCILYKPFSAGEAAERCMCVCCTQQLCMLHAAAGRVPSRASAPARCLTSATLLQQLCWKKYSPFTDPYASAGAC